MKKIVFLILCFISLIGNAQKTIMNKKSLAVSNLFTDHMVLQQKQNTSFWGITTPQREVEVTASWGKKAKTIADEEGKWKLKLETPTAGGPYTIKLSTPEKELSGFEIAGADKVFLPAKAKIQDNKVIVSNTAITQPVYVRYAWTDASGASLFNKNGLPAATFTSEE